MRRHFGFRTSPNRHNKKRHHLEHTRPEHVPIKSKLFFKLGRRRCVNSFAANIVLDYDFDYKKGDWSWDNKAIFGYGLRIKPA